MTPSVPVHYPDSAPLAWGGRHDPAAGAVVDGEFRVHGVVGLRVVDASVIARATAGRSGIGSAARSRTCASATSHAPSRHPRPPSMAARASSSGAAAPARSPPASLASARVARMRGSYQRAVPRARQRQRGGERARCAGRAARGQLGGAEQRPRLHPRETRIFSARGRGV
jgi:hypothetical protein